MEPRSSSKKRAQNKQNNEINSIQPSSESSLKGVNDPAINVSQPSN